MTSHINASDHGSIHAKIIKRFLELNGDNVFCIIISFTLFTVSV